MSGSFESKVVVITGAAGGIGSAAALRFAQEGAGLVPRSRAQVAGWLAREHQ